MDAILLMGQAIKKTAAIDPLGCAKLVVFANAPQDNPFMAGAFHGEGEPETVINVGISGPGVVRAVLAQMDDADLGELSETIKRTAFKITSMGELVGREMAEKTRRRVRYCGPVARALRPQRAIQLLISSRSWASKDAALTARRPRWRC